MPTVTKKEMIDQIADTTGERGVVVRQVVQALLDSVIVELGRGNRLELRDFGVFEVRHRKSRRAQNPRTLEPVQTKPSRVVVFKVGRAMGGALNGRRGASYPNKRRKRR